MMRFVGVVALVLVGCGGGLSSQEAARQVDQLVVLYSENRPKFVEQKQAMIQADSCERAEKLRGAADAKLEAAAMSPENNEALTAVQMELAQAEKECKAK